MGAVGESNTPLTDAWFGSYTECDPSFKAGLDEGRNHANEIERKLHELEAEVKSGDKLMGEVLASLVDISETLMHCLAKQARKMQDDPDFPEASMLIGTVVW